MQKKELLHLHVLMFTIRTYFESITHNQISTEQYNSLEISPLHIHKDKSAHRDALLTLGGEIVSHICSHPVPAANGDSETAPRPDAAEH